jgi:2-alkenal reductase
MKGSRPAFAVLMVLSVSLFACRMFTPEPAGALQNTSTYTGQAAESQVYSPPPALDLVNQGEILSRVYEIANPGVVALRSLSVTVESQGSGFVIDKEGHILTNYHVVEGATELEVGFPSGLKARGRLVGSDADSDLAVLAVEVHPDLLFPLKFSDSDQIKVGQTVIAIGNPFGFKSTMTMGIISGLGRTMESMHVAPDGGMFSAGDIIQTDAAINPGNSGGPLLNLSGEVIGINRAIFTTNFSASGEPVNSGLGFAVSINIARRVVPHLIQYGKYEYPYLGITSTGINDLSILEREALHMEQVNGIYITAVTPGSPAAMAGLIGGDRPTNIADLMAGGDLIIAVDGQPVDTFDDFIGYLIKNKSPGERIVLTIVREDREFQVDLVLGKRPDS